MADQPMDRVVPLDELNDFEIAEGDPDVRGWDVIASDGARIGEVDDLLVDPGALKVRYLDVDLDDDLMANSEDKDRHILIPIGYARLEEDDDRIFVDNLGSAQIKSIPAYNHGPLDPDYESMLRRHLDGDYTTAPAPPPAAYGEFNERDDDEADSIFGSRREETEGARDAQIREDDERDRLI